MASPGPGKRVPADHLLRQPQLAAHLPHFVLEQLAQRLQQLERQPLGQPADVVVGLDRDRRTALRRERFDHVGIERALHQESHVLAHRPRFGLEHVDEGVADAAPLLLGIGDAGQRSRKRVAAHPRPGDRCPGGGGRSAPPAPARAGAAARDPRRCRSAGRPRPGAPARRRPTSPRRPRARRSPARSGPTSSRIRATSVSTKCPGVQSGVTAADLEQEVVEDLAAPRRVGHLGMELHAEQRPVRCARTRRSGS